MRFAANHTIRSKDDSDDAMPISLAARSGNVASMKLLLDKGLDANKAVGRVRFPRLLLCRYNKTL